MSSRVRLFVGFVGPAVAIGWSYSQPVASTGNDASNSISMLLGSGDGTFKRALCLPARNNHSVAIADLDGDSNNDLISAAYADRYARYYRGDGAANFTITPGIDLSGTYARGVAVGDFNRDQRLDLAVTDDRGGTVTILLAD